MKRALWMVLIPPLALAAGLVAWMLAGGFDAHHWPIRWLDVEGRLERVTAAQVRAAVADEARGGFFRLDVDRARAAVEELPWVARASVARRWPDALKIAVVEQRPVARWSQRTLLGSGGEPFEVAGSDGMQGLVSLAGPESRRAEVFALWQRLHRALLAEGLEIGALTLDARGAWRLQLVGGPELLLGRDEIDARIARFLDVRGALGPLDRMARIDLRYPNGLAIRPARAPARGAMARESEQTTGAREPERTQVESRHG